MPKAKPSKRAPGSKSGALAAMGLRIVSSLFSVAVWALLLGAAGVIYLALDLPQVDEATLTRRPNIRLIDSTGWEIASFGDIYSRAIDLKALPKYVPAAVVAVEDRRFYQHPGVDVRGLVRALVAHIKAGRTVQGGSTITQQVAKNLFLTSERTLVRKLREALLALKLERTFTKDQILTLYMNRVYFGGGIYGFQAASERFFGRPAEELSVFEAAILAGLLRAPSHYNPAREPERAKTRAAIVLGTMVETGALPQTEADKALKGAARTLKAVVAPSSYARYFADWVLNQVDGYVGTIQRDLIIRTTLDGRLQVAAEQALLKNLNAAGAKLRIEQGAVVVLGSDGAVRAMVGGRDHADSQFNRATQALRQPGSAFKPFLYLAAVEEGLRPEDMVTDAPITIGRWKPQNFDGKYLGEVSVETAVAKSINTAAVRVAQNIGPGAIVAAARRLGIAQPLKPELSLALGSGEVTLLELTGAYAPFANGGEAVLPYAVLDIATRAGEVLYQREEGGLGQVVAPENVAVMNRLLSGVVTTGTGMAAAFGYPIAGKTGTSSDFRDAWFMGYSTDYVAGVWVGNDSGAGMKGVTGGGLPAVIWRDLMAQAHVGHDPRPLPGLEAQEAGSLSELLKVFTN